MSVESLSKLLELAAKFAWPVLLVVAFVLLVPEHIAVQLGFEPFRSMYLGYLSLLGVFSGAVLVASYTKAMARLLWRFVLCPLKKLGLPVRDHRAGIAQSRMRYYLVEFRMAESSPITVYQEVDSNGNMRRYVFEHGERFIPPEVHECSHVGDAGFRHPSWARVDWRDVFNGDAASGCWGISER